MSAFMTLSTRLSLFAPPLFDEHDVHTLVPERKLSFTDTIVADIFRCPDGASRGALTVRWDEYYWIAVDACFETLSEEGSRKDVVAKKSAQTPFRKGRFTFASLVWFIGGSLARAELLTLKPGDGVLLRHGISKNDQFGSYSDSGSHKVHPLCEKQPRTGGYPADKINSFP